MDNSKGIKSIEVGYRVLLAVQRGPSPVQLTEVARRAELSTGAAHNYLVSLGRVGLVEREGRGAYRLGPSAFALSLASFSQLSHYDVIRQAAQNLHDITGLAVAVSIWSQAGPVSIFNQPGPDAHEFIFRSGLLSLLRTAASKIYLTYLPDEVSLPLLVDELKRMDRDPAEARSILENDRAQVSPTGYAKWTDTNNRNVKVVSFAAPVWGAEREISFCLSILAREEKIDPAIDEKPLAALLDIARTFSRR